MWYNIGVCLHIPTGTLEAIQYDNRYVAEDCFRSMLKEWLKTEQPNTTWAALAEAMRSSIVGHEELAVSLQLRLFKSS